MGHWQPMKLKLRKHKTKDVVPNIEPMIYLEEKSYEIASCN